MDKENQITKSWRVVAFGLPLTKNISDYHKKIKTDRIEEMRVLKKRFSWDTKIFRLRNNIVTIQIKWSKKEKKKIPR